MSWKVISKSPSNHVVDVCLEVFTNGLIKAPNVYTVKNEDTEKTSKVTTINKEHLTTKISKGQFY